MAKKKDDAFEELDERYAGTQQPLLPKTPKEELRAMSKAERDIVEAQEEQAEQRAKATKEYEEKMAEAEQNEERPDEPEKPPEACEQFEGYGMFTVPSDVNIRHQDHKAGGHVALSWEDYQALRDQKIYCEPVPKTEHDLPAQQPV